MDLVKGNFIPQSKKIYVQKQIEMESKSLLKKETESHGFEGDSTSKNVTFIVELPNATIEASVEIIHPPTKTIQQNNEVQSRHIVVVNEPHNDNQEVLLAIQETQAPHNFERSQNKEEDALSSSGFEFLDATQMKIEQEEDVRNKLINNVKHDMEFLKQSWTNIIEEPDNLEEIDKNFQLVVSKQAKKKNKSVQKPNKVDPSIITRVVSFNTGQ